MVFTAIVAAFVALGWALLSILTSASSQPLPRDPTTLELAGMAVVTFATYAWARRDRPLPRNSIAGSVSAGRSEAAESAAVVDDAAAEHAA